jgi:plasmid stabilization system protein ParE
MTPVVSFRPAARAEFDEAIDWYENRQAGFGDKFEKEVQQAIDRIKWNPASRAPVYKDVRCVSVHRFPYTVFYRVTGNAIRIVSVFHAKRDPRVWQARV